MDASAFKQTYLPLSERLFRSAWRLTANKEAAEDLVQETFLRLWTKRHLLDKTENPGAFATAPLRHIHCDRRDQTAREGNALPADRLALAAPTDIAHAVETQDRAAIVRRMIARLPEPQRSVITMKDLEGLPNDEIARLTRLSEGNVRVLLSRARKAIRDKFKTRNDG